MSEAKFYYVVKLLGKYCTGGAADNGYEDPGLSSKRSRAYPFPSKESALGFVEAWSSLAEYYACHLRVVKVNRG